MKRNVIFLTALILLISVFTGCTSVEGGCTPSYGIETQQSVNTEEAVTESTQPVNDNCILFGTDNIGYVLIDGCDKDRYKLLKDNLTVDIVNDKNVALCSSSDTICTNSCYKLKVAGNGTGLNTIILSNLGSSVYVDKLFANSNLTDTSSILSETMCLTQSGINPDPTYYTEFPISDWDGIISSKDNESNAVFRKEFNGTYYVLYFSGKADSFEIDCKKILRSFSPAHRKQTIGLLCTSGLKKNDLDSRRRFSDDTFGIIDTHGSSVDLYKVDLKEAGADTSDKTLTLISNGAQKIDGNLKNELYSFGIYSKTKTYDTFEQELVTWDKEVKEMSSKSGKAIVEIYKSDSIINLITTYVDCPFVVNVVAPIDEGPDDALDFIKNLQFDKITSYSI